MACFPPCFSKGLQKRDFLDIYLSTISCNFGNTSAMRFIFVWKCSKFYLHFKNAEKNGEEVFPFRDNCIWIGCIKLSLLRREYLWPAFNLLKRETFSNLIPCTVINKYGKSGAIQISALFDPIYHIVCRRVLWNATF